MGFEWTTDAPQASGEFSFPSKTQQFLRRGTGGWSRGGEASLRSDHPKGRALLARLANRAPPLCDARCHLLARRQSMQGAFLHARGDPAGLSGQPEKKGNARRRRQKTRKVSKLRPDEPRSEGPGMAGRADVAAGAESILLFFFFSRIHSGVTVSVSAENILQKQKQDRGAP